LVGGRGDGDLPAASIVHTGRAVRFPSISPTQELRVFRAPHGATNAGTEGATGDSANHCADRRTLSAAQGGATGRAGQSAKACADSGAGPLSAPLPRAFARGGTTQGKKQRRHEGGKKSNVKSLHDLPPAPFMGAQISIVE
jgi:hypothetical protein